MDAIAQGAYFSISVWNQPIFFSQSFNLLVFLNRGGNSITLWLSLFSLLLSLGLRSLGSVKFYHHLVQLPNTEILFFWAESSCPHLVHRCPPSVTQGIITFQVGYRHMGASIFSLGFWEAVNESLISLAVGDSSERVCFQGCPPSGCFIQGMVKREERQNSDMRRYLHKIIIRHLKLNIRKPMCILYLLILSTYLF